ncbi:hypothetical protein AB6N23_01335 [Cellulomonas sp. 179-A 9B4 NHS]|uniref:hypothetical protein n=1 Tax=Cellulomonas sp. 179-A 9B4 NHS TaxID=3142379 RepID=UPI0039A18C87
MHRNVTRVATAALLSATLVAASAAGASASAPELVEAPATVVAEFEQHLESEGSASDVATYEALTEEQQAQLVAVLTSPDPTSQPGVEIVESRTVTSAPARSALAGPSRSHSLNAVDRTSDWRIDAKMFGITIGYFRQVFNYQTSSTAVVSSQKCRGTWTGFAGFWNISQVNSHYVTNGFGHCYTDFDLDVVFKGAAGGMNKEMYTKTSRYGMDAWHLINI